MQGQEYAGTASRLQKCICQDWVHTMLPEASVLKTKLALSLPVTGGFVMGIQLLARKSLLGKFNPQILEGPH